MFSGWSARTFAGARKCRIVTVRDAVSAILVMQLGAVDFLEAIHPGTDIGS